MFVSTSGYQDAQDTSESVSRQTNPNSVFNGSKHINAIPDQMEFLKDKNFFENRSNLTTSPVQLTQSEIEKVLNIHKKESEENPVLTGDKPVLPNDKQVDPESRSSTSYSMEFEEEDEEVQVCFLEWHPCQFLYGAILLSMKIALPKLY